MKKIVALLLVVLMSLTCFAMAETAPVSMALLSRPSSALFTPMAMSGLCSSTHTRTAQEEPSKPYFARS